MPFVGIGLHVLVAIFFAVHAIRRGADMYWLLILFMFPLLGSIVYFFAIYLPELRGSRAVHVARRAVAQAIDPGRELREANRSFEMAPTIDNRLRLAEALLNAGDAARALTHYSEAAQGPFADDPKLLRGLAATQLELGQMDASRITLDRLFAAHAELRRQPQLALLYARVLAGTRDAGARDAFEAALTVAADAEVKCRFAEWLAENGDGSRAQTLYAEIIKDSAHWHKHAKAHNAEWFRRARAALGQ
ncbi:hypothetical protein [Uliginosibacterium gangwonense]|uniref:hypothetical protein n=1 Tax=Uliginosibacterium gangwonense TaxID=392736 RepID=UPI0003698476|nr:hypothetical protein [Uliginosibacterium gangwonense]